MKLHINQCKIICGIYKIYFKSDPELFYIGSSINIIRRFKHHKRKIKYNSHPKLAFYARRFGVEDMAFTILKICKKNELIFYEQYFISELQPPLNDHKFASMADGTNMDAMILAKSEFGKEWIPEIVIERFCDDEFMNIEIIPLNDMITI